MAYASVSICVIDRTISNYVKLGDASCDITRPGAERAASGKCVQRPLVHER